MVSFESFIITETTTDFAGWEAEGVFLEQGGKAEGPTSVASAILNIKGLIPAPVGATLHLNASAEGGRAKECLFFRRLEHDRFDVIQPWSEDMSAAWRVETNEKRPCVAEILPAVRNVEHLPGEETITIRKDIPVVQSGC